jgi:hypothetical protein
VTRRRHSTYASGGRHPADARRPPDSMGMTDESTAGAPLNIDIPPDIRLDGVDPVTDAQFLLAVGAVVRASSLLEFTLRATFINLNAGEAAAVVAAGQSMDWLLSMNRAIAKHRSRISDVDRDRLNLLLDRARHATQQRNRFVHDLWRGSPAGPLLRRSQRRKMVLTGPAYRQALRRVGEPPAQRRDDHGGEFRPLHAPTIDGRRTQLPPVVRETGADPRRPRRVGPDRRPGRTCPDRAVAAAATRCTATPTATARRAGGTIAGVMGKRDSIRASRLSWRQEYLRCRPGWT